jgi:NAD-dependent SIR2 family protein deacetylase
MGTIVQLKQVGEKQKDITCQKCHAEFYQFVETLKHITKRDLPECKHCAERDELMQMIVKQLKAIL